MPFDNFILAAIGGTNSWNYKNCHAKNFYRDFCSTHKDYFHGPVTSGSDVNSICDHVVNFITKENNRLGTSVPICLVGHSRGGLIAINSAYRLKSLGISVYFLGLYDSVDRAFGMSGNIIRNVSFTYHALRSPEMKSRIWFSNTCVEDGETICQDGGEYYQEYFMTSHGGIGGDPITDFSLGADNSCVSYGENPGWSFMCENESSRVNLWMRSNAKIQGLPIAV